MEKPHRMGFLGPAGTHSEAAALWLRGYLREADTDAPVRKLVPYPDIDDVLVAVERGEIDSGFVPVENSLEGAIRVTLDVLAHTDALAVVREVIWPVHNELMAHCQAEDVRKIYSHAQPISQCRDYLAAYFPQAELVKVASTARAAKIAAAARPEDGIAAICTARAGSLVDVLLEFSRRGINMTRIESRPARTQLGDYIFFFDLDTDAGEEMLAEAIAAVRAKCSWLKNLGRFPVLTAKC